MKKLKNGFYLRLLSLVLIASVIFIGCNKTDTSEKKVENIQLKTKLIQLETINLIANKLKEKGLLTSQNVNMSLNSSSQFIPSTFSELQIIDIMEPLVNNGQQIQQELILAVANTREWEALGENGQSELVNMSSQQLASLALLYSAVNLEDAIHDCVGLALGVAGLNGLIRNIATGPTVSSAIGILKWFGKRYLSYVGIAWMVWDFTSCMGHFDYNSYTKNYYNG
jgi:hypothetical protein